VFFSDKCGGQNLNQYISTMCLYCVSTLPIESIDHIFMVSGHSHMEVDSMHARIENTSRNMEVRVPYEWEVVANLAREKDPYDITHVDQDMVYDWKTVKKAMKINNVTKGTRGEVARWKSTLENPGINWLRYGKEYPRTIFFKQGTYEQNAPFGKIETVVKLNRRTLTVPEPLPLAYEGPLPIPYLKYRDLMKLCDENVIKDPWKGFYKNLPSASNAEENPEDDEIRTTIYEE